MASLGDIVAFNLTDDLRFLRGQIEDLSRRKLPSVPMSPAQKAAWDRHVSRLKQKLNEKQALVDLLKYHHSAATDAMRNELRSVMLALHKLLLDPEICNDLMSEQASDFKEMREQTLQVAEAMTLQPGRPVIMPPSTHAPDPVSAVMLGVAILVDFARVVLRRRSRVRHQKRLF